MLQRTGLFLHLCMGWRELCWLPDQCINCHRGPSSLPRDEEGAFSGTVHSGDRRAHRSPTQVPMSAVPEGRRVTLVDSFKKTAE